MAAAEAGSARMRGSGSGMDAASEGDPNGRDAGGLRAPDAGVDG